MPLWEDLVEVLDIQTRRTSDPNDPVMRRRKELVERSIPAELERILHAMNPAWKAEGSGGKGGPAEVPWSRYFDPEMSPRAGLGWYVVYLFSASGDSVYLSLNQGTTTWDTNKKDFVFRTGENLRARVQTARKILRWAGFSDEYSDIDLQPKQRLGRAYEQGNVHAFSYSAEKLSQIRPSWLDNDIMRMAEMLEVLYECELRGVNFEDPDSVDPADVPARGSGMPRIVRVSDDIQFNDGVSIPVGTEATLSLTRTVVLPSVTSDEIDGPDMLGIDADARALATVIAAKQVVPPLAIALYGEWGSGKSFFMHRIERHIKQFGMDDQAGQVFEPATAHIRFRAWHYERGHLMASLHRQIFEALDFDESRLTQERTAAANRIETLNSEIDALDGKIEEAETKRDDLQGSLEKVRARQEDENEQLKEITLRDIVAAAKSDPAMAAWLAEMIKDLKLDEAQASALEVTQTAREVWAVKDQIKFLGKPGRGGWWSSPLMGAALAALLMLGVIVGFGFWLPDVVRSVGNSIGVAASLIAGLATGVGRQIRLFRTFLEPAERFQSMVEQRIEEKRAKDQGAIEELQRELDAAECKVAVMEKRRADKEIERKEAERQRDELTPASNLKRFITDRAKTTEYDEQLGVVTRIHRDLHELGECLKDALEDKTSPFNRLVLYIDDLDRCSATTVMAVLEAVHLFLALPQFVVMVGVDHRSLECSLRGAHRELLSDKTDSPAPADYLEKIFQLTYTLPSMTPDGCRAILREAISLRPARIDLEINSAPEDPESDSEPVPEEALIGAGSPSDDPSSQPSVEELAQQAEQPTSSVDQYVISSLDITDEDCATLDLVSLLVATTPRRAKRFLTIYIVVRARLAGLEYNSAAVALLVAALVGAPNTLGRALRKVDDPAALDQMFGNWCSSTFEDQAYPVESARAAAFVASAGWLMELRLRDIVAYRQEVVRYTIGITHDLPDLAISNPG
ncbi:MrcB family domain-containing protein [Nocardia tengchongensis]|uniref:MrcB family domain-containing protein n=1 Tax=Nocardia tengchongensis TaxID=2055889 RepID=UPI0036C99DE3